MGTGSDHRLASPAVLPRANRSVDRTLALWTAPRRFAGFKRFVERHSSVDTGPRHAVAGVGVDEIDRLGDLLGVDEGHLAQLVAIYLGLPFRLELDSASVDFDLLPRHFCERQLVVPQRQESGRPRFALGNPFRWALSHVFETHRIGAEEADFVIVTPREARRALERSRNGDDRTRRTSGLTADHPTINASQPLEPLHRILFLHTLPGSAVS